MGSCHCLCAMHNRFSTVECAGHRDVEVTMGGFIVPPRAIPMCAACAVWWQESDPHARLWPFVRLFEDPR